jgi:hypothetical protein
MRGGWAGGRQSAGRGRDVGVGGGGAGERGVEGGGLGSDQPAQADADVEMLLPAGRKDLPRGPAE